MSDDRSRSLSVILFIGSVFSPYYYWRGRQDPADHIAANVALYGGAARPLPGPLGPNRWSMTERRRSALTRDASTLRLGPTQATWDGGGLTVRIDETSVPHLAPLRGEIRIEAPAPTRRDFRLDAGGRHGWWPIAPAARIAVDFSRPRLSWSGAGYLDMNWGAEPLEAGFRYWNWSRAATAAGATIFYEADRRDGSSLRLAVEVDRETGEIRETAPPPEASLPTTLWGVRRATRCDAGAAPREVRRLEDAPFYARAELETTLDGAQVGAVHETLDLDRFSQRWVKALLPWRMPRTLW